MNDSARNPRIFARPILGGDFPGFHQHGDELRDRGGE